MFPRQPSTLQQSLLVLLFFFLLNPGLNIVAQQKCLPPTADAGDAPVTTIVWAIDGVLAQDLSKVGTPSVGSYIYRIQLDLTNGTATFEAWFLTPNAAALSAGGRGLYETGDGAMCFDKSKKVTCQIYYTIAKGGTVFLATATADKIKDQGTLFDAQDLCFKAGACDANTFNNGIADLAGSGPGDIWLNAYQKPQTIYHYQYTLNGPKWIYVEKLDLQNAKSGFDGLEVLPDSGFVANWSDMLLARPRASDPIGNYYTRYDKAGNIVKPDPLIDTTKTKSAATGIVFDAANKIFIVSGYKAKALYIYDTDGNQTCTISLKPPRTTYAPCGGVYGSICIEDLSLEGSGSNP